MPKNTKGGNKAKKQKNSNVQERNRDIPFPEDGDDSHIAIIEKVCGDMRYYVKIVDAHGIQPKVYNANLSTGTKNKYGRGIIIGVGTYVLMAIREFQKDKADIIFVYKDSEKSLLVDNNFISNTMETNNIIESEIQFSDTIKNSNVGVEMSDSIKIENTVTMSNDDEFDYSAI